MTSTSLSRRRFLIGSGAIAVSFSLLGGDPAEAAESSAQADDGELRIWETGATPTQSWLVMTPETTTIYSGKVELGTGIQTAFIQLVAEELHIQTTDFRLKYVQGDTLLGVSQGGTVGSKSIQVGGLQLRQAAATAFAELKRRAATALGVPENELFAVNGEFQAGSKTITYTDLLASGTTVLTRDENAPLVAPEDYTIVGFEEPRVDLPSKINATFTYLHDLTVPGMLHGRVVRPPGRNASQPVIGNLDRAQAIEGFVAVVQQDRFIGVVATTEWAAARAAAATTGISVTWTSGPSMIPQDELDTALRDPANQYTTVIEKDEDIDTPLASARTVLTARYFTPFQMHASMGASTAVADVRTSPDPETGIQATIWTASQNVTALQGAIAPLLGLSLDQVRVLYTESSGCYGHNGADDCAADAALLSQAVGAPVRVQWTRADEHGWEPLGGAQAHDMTGGLGPDGITAWSHTLYGLSTNSRPVSGNPGTLIAGALKGFLPADLPATSVDATGRNAPIIYDIPQRLEARLVKTFQTTGPTSASPSAPLTYLLPRTSAFRSLGGFSNSFANESFFDELAHAGGFDPLELRIASLPDPRAAAVCAALRGAWEERPTGAGVGAGVAFHQYEVAFAYVATYVEVHVDLDTGVVTVDRVLVAHDCGLIVNPDGLRNQIEGNVIQGVSRALKEEVQYSDDRITTLSWEASSFSTSLPYEVIRFNEVPSIAEILINHPDQPAWGAGEATIGTMSGAIANAVFAATGVRIRTLPLTPARVKAALDSASAT